MKFCSDTSGGAEARINRNKNKFRVVVVVRALKRETIEKSNKDNDEWPSPFFSFFRHFFLIAFKVDHKPEMATHLFNEEPKGKIDKV